MPCSIASLWRNSSSDFASALERCVNAVCDRIDSNTPGIVFFRADDIGVPGKQFARLMDLFTRYGVPLSLAVVPAWLTRSRWIHIQRLGDTCPSLWCWHQHGWRHMNHEKKRKKQEFGPSRSRDLIREDLIRGRKRLEKLMGEAFYPVFTPPWNRCDINTLELLKDLEYHAVSGSRENLPQSPAELPDLFVNVDLHTRKSTNPAADLCSLFSELEQALSVGYCGIMIHHRCMNDTAFSFLELLLKALISAGKISVISMKSLLEKPLKNAQFCSSSRKAKILTRGIH